MFFKLVFFYARDTWNIKTIAFILTLFLLTAILAFGLPDASDLERSVFQPVRLSVVDEDQSIISYTLVDQFENLDIVEQIHLDTLERAQQRLAAGEVLLIMVIPENYYEDTRAALNQSSITVYLNETMPAEATVFIRMLNNASDSIAGIQSALYAYEDALLPLYDDPQVLNRQVEAATVDLAFRLVGRKALLKVDQSSQLNTVLYIISSLLTLLAMMTSLLILSQVQQEKKSGLHNRLILAGIRSWQLAAGKQLILLIWLLTGFSPLLVLIRNIYPHSRSWLLISALVLVCLASSAMMMIMAYLSPGQETTLLSAWLLLLVFLLAGGCIYPYALLPSWLQFFSIISPARWSFLLIYNELAGRQLSLTGLAVLAAILIAAQGTAILVISRARTEQI